jgi:hypothetical protein
MGFEVRYDTSLDDAVYAGKWIDRSIDLARGILLHTVACLTFLASNF